MKHLPINQWKEDEKPREKLQLLGQKGLSDVELLGIILGTGARIYDHSGKLVSKSAIDLGRELLDLGGGSLQALTRLSLEELTRVKGIGPVKAITVMAALELGNKRRWAVPEDNIVMISSSKSAYELFRYEVQDLPVEHFWVALLNKANKVIKKLRLSVGGIDGTVADPTLIAKNAVLNNARGVILCHNHPSGELHPSTQDLKLTEKVKKGLAFLDIQLLDHIIITPDSYTSFADEGIL